MYLVHNREGVQGQPLPIDPDSSIDIPEDLVGDLGKIKKFADELNNSRLELGRLSQVVHHLINVCNTAEKNLADSKKKLIEELGLTDGNWAIDFENNKVCRILPTDKTTLNVV
jgi:hypothetical protein